MDRSPKTMLPARRRGSKVSLGRHCKGRGTIKNRWNGKRGANFHDGKGGEVGGQARGQTLRHSNKQPKGGTSGEEQLRPGGKGCRKKER